MVAPGRRGLEGGQVTTKSKARIFKEGRHWTWTHVCFHGQGIGRYRHASHANALEGALKHVRWCNR